MGSKFLIIQNLLFQIFNFLGIPRNCYRCRSLSLKFVSYNFYNEIGSLILVFLDLNWFYNGWICYDWISVWWWACLCPWCNGFSFCLDLKPMNGGWMGFACISVKKLRWVYWSSWCFFPLLWFLLLPCFLWLLLLLLLLPLEQF